MGARATLLTGYQTYGIKSMRMEGNTLGASISKKSPFWPAVFRKNGYQTAQIGKWHTGTDNGWDATGIFKKFGIAPHSLKIPETILKNNFIQTNGKKQ